VSDDPKRVLVIEDDPAHAELIRRAFEPLSDRVIIDMVGTLADAREWISSSTPEILVADLLLPDGKSLELLSGAPGRTEFPVVIMTSQGDEQLAVESLKLGAVDYVVKSESTFSDLPHIVDRALRQWQLVLDREEAREELQENEALFRSLIENAQDLITVIDENSNITYQSPSSFRMLGREAGVMVGNSVFLYVNPRDHEMMTNTLKLAFAAPGTKQTLVCRILHANGSWLTLESIGSAHDDRGGERRVVVNSRDITEKRLAEEENRKLEAQLRQSQRLETIGTMADGIAHDFNNILTPMLGYAELALEDVLPDSRASSDLKHVIRAASRAQELVNQILLFSRQTEQESKPVMLQNLADESLKLLRASLPPDVQIIENIDPGCGPVLADATQIQQVLMNLGTNASHAMSPGGGRLTVDVAAAEYNDDFRASYPLIPPGNYVRLSVSDTGSGMDPETLDRIFEPFFTTKEVGQGTGLGLSIVHGIIRRHGGEITVESAPGEGTRFDIFFRCSDPGVGKEITDE